MSALQMCASTLCQDAPSGTRRAPPSFACRSLIGSLSPPVCIIHHRPSRSNDEAVSSALLVAIFLPMPEPKEKGDPDNRNERMPAVGSDQLALTSAPDRTTE